MTQLLHPRRRLHNAVRPGGDGGSLNSETLLITPVRRRNRRGAEGIGGAQSRRCLTDTPIFTPSSNSTRQEVTARAAQAGQRQNGTLERRRAGALTLQWPGHRSPVAASPTTGLLTGDKSMPGRETSSHRCRAVWEGPEGVAAWVLFQVVRSLRL